MKVRFLQPGLQCSRPDKYADFCEIINGLPCWKLGTIVTLDGKAHRLVQMGVAEEVLGHVNNESQDAPRGHAVHGSERGDATDSD